MNEIETHLNPSVSVSQDLIARCEYARKQFIRAANDAVIVLLAFAVGAAYLFTLFQRSTELLGSVCLGVGVALSSIVVVLFGIGLWRVSVNLKELSKGYLVRTEGSIVWIEERYEIQAADGLKIFTLPYEELDLVPGRYMLTYLARSRRLIMNERIGDLQSGMQKVGRTLAQLLEVTEKDMVACRAGQLSDPVRARIRRRILKSIREDIGGWVLSLAIMDLIAFIIILFAPSAKDELLPTIGIVNSIFATITAFASVVRWLVLRTQLQCQSVLDITGTLTKEVRRINNADHYFFYVVGTQFELPTKVYKALVDQQLYRIYFLPKGDHLIAIESVA